jgi:hypothetical protein
MSYKVDRFQGTTGDEFCLTRREVLKLATASTVKPVLGGTHLAAGSQEGSTKGPLSFSDGPASNRFHPIQFEGNSTIAELPKHGVSQELGQAANATPSGSGTAWGMLFDVPNRFVVVGQDPVTVTIVPVRYPWFVFLHTSDTLEPREDEQGFQGRPLRGPALLNTHSADYVVIYSDGSEARSPIRQRHQIGMFGRPWGVNCFEAVALHKPHPRLPDHEQSAGGEWGESQTRVNSADWAECMTWLWALENLHPEKMVTGFRFEPVRGTVLLFAITGGSCSSNPLRWESRRKALFRLPDGSELDERLNKDGLLSQIQLDMGQIISAQRRREYENHAWTAGHFNQTPNISDHDVLIEYAAHPDATFHLHNGTQVPVSELVVNSRTSPLTRVARATKRVTVRVFDKGSRKPVPVRLHVHGEAGEYLAPVDRHRLINSAWFEDYSVDLAANLVHPCTYIPGESSINLPLGKVYLEVTKGFEIKPVRKVMTITESTETITIELEKVLKWREKGWVTADTHVHFLSPPSALLEGAAEGVNVVNLLASQWGELMTNVGDFDGKTTFGSKESGGDGEFLVRVGTENRQHVMGHISLLGYNDQIIAPMTTGGPDESALGDPIEILLTEWARQCKQQGGVTILPHFPYPRAENAASIVSGVIDGVEMTSWSNLYEGIDPYSLCDWYRYLNCGYFVAAVGGTDKMDAATAVGTVRTYTRLDPSRPFDYNGWKEAIRRGNTFVTYGPLVEFTADGKPMGSRITMTANGGTVDVTWEAESVTVPMSRVELIVNGTVHESQSISQWRAGGHWSVKLGKSSWLALLIRGQYPGKPEMIAAHTSPVIVELKGKPFFAAADALTILEQIEGALAYVDTIGTRAEDMAYKRMRMVLQNAHRSLHNRMHQQGVYHHHTPATDHTEHHGHA